MGVMTVVETAGRFTRADFEALPEDGRYRYELLDGAIIMSPPSPGVAHQLVVTKLALWLSSVAPSGLEVLVAPLDTYLPTDDILQPDVLVFDPGIVVDDKVQGVPLLVVEVLSPSSRRRDVGDKLTAYRDAAVPSYWVVDPLNARLRVWRLEDGEYVEVTDVSGEDEWTAEAPFPVTVRPADLCR
jgi:Uma2 family endonuclease